MIYNIFLQGSISTDSVEISMNNSNVIKKESVSQDQVNNKNIKYINNIVDTVATHIPYYYVV